MNTHEIIGKPVISMADGTKIGDVKDILINPEAFTASVLLIHGSEKGDYLPWGNIKGIGKDAVTIEDAGKIEDDPKLAELLRSYKALERLAVVNGSGESLGAVSEMHFDTLGHMIQLETRAGGVFGIGARDDSVVADEVRSIGPKFITVEKKPTPS